MLAIDRRVLQAAWTLVLFALVLLALYEIGHTLIIFALALFLAHLLSPAVDFVERYIPQRISRTAALAIVYLILLGVLIAAAIPLGSKIGEQAANLAKKLPDTLKSDPLASVPLPRWLEPNRPELNAYIQERVQQIGQEVLPTLSRAAQQILTGIGSALSVILIPILSFFFLKDGAAIRVAIIDLFHEDSRPMVDAILTDLHWLLAKYMRALVFLALATFTSFTIFLSIAGVPYSFLLAGVAGLLEVIPVFGPLIAAVAILLVAALSGFHHLLVLLMFLALYRVFQDYVLSPYLMSAGVEVHPLLVLFGVLAGEQLAGIPGMFFSVPAIAALRVVIERVRRRPYAI